MRLQKALADAGVASRRRSEELMRAGRVMVNGEVVREMGTLVDATRDRITVDGRPIRTVSEHTYLMLHKPRHVITTVSDPEGRPTVMDYVPRDKRLFPVGRLDTNSEGLVLLTDDGALANRLMHPRYEHEKEYRVLVAGRPSSAALEKLRAGVALADGRTAPVRVDSVEHVSGDSWLRIILREGRKRQIRRMMESVGHRVKRLIRVRLGPLLLGDLPPGQSRPLTPREVSELMNLSSLRDQLIVKRFSRVPMTIAIDGPSASGKSTVGELLAHRLNYLYFDTGVMYRALTCEALQRDLDLNDESLISQLAQQLKIDVLPPTVSDGRQNTILADGKDITNELRSSQIDANVSAVSSYRQAREAMVRQQREIGQRGRVVMIGRDIGTVVLPNADLKIYLDASVECRAERRYKENVARGDCASYAEVLRMMKRRDELDMGRQNSPLRPAEDAHVIDTEPLDVPQVVDAIERFWK